VIVVGTVDPGNVHARLDHGGDEFGVGGRFPGQGHHDPGGSPRAHETEDVAGIGIQDVVTAVESLVGRLKVPWSVVPAQGCHHGARGLYLGPDVGLGGCQGRGTEVHQVVLQSP